MAPVDTDNVDTDYRPVGADNFKARAAVAGGMKLQKVVNRVRGENTYHRFQVVLPSDQVEALGWDGGDELEAVKRGNSLLLRRVAGRKG